MQYVKCKAAFGIFKNNDQVSTARAELRAQGFGKTAIEVMYPFERGAQDFGQRQETMIKAGAVLGAILGAIIALIVTIILSMGIFSLPLPVSVSAGPNQLLFSVGLFIGVMFFGTTVGTLIGVGTPKTAGERYGEYVDSGGILMSVNVHTADQTTRAKKALDDSGAQDISVLDERAGWNKVYQKTAELKEKASR
jgi:hypothetical protein